MAIFSFIRLVNYDIKISSNGDTKTQNTRHISNSFQHLPFNLPISSYTRWNKKYHGISLQAFILRTALRTTPEESKGTSLVALIKPVILLCQPASRTKKVRLFS